jgi:predicted permease
MSLWFRVAKVSREDRQREDTVGTEIVRSLDAVVDDLRFSARQLWKHKVATVAALVSLGLAIGGCVSAFRIVDALLLRPLPVREPANLYILTRSDTGRADGPEKSDGFEYPLFRVMRDAAQGDAELLAISYVERVDLSLERDAATERVNLQYVSGGMFASFGLQPAIGRLLNDGDDWSPRAHPYAVISCDYWTRRFGQSARVIGQTVTLGEDRFEIVGVVDRPFTGTEPGTMTDVFVPAMMHPGIERVDWSWLRAFVRVNAEADVPALQGRLQAAFSSFNETTARKFGARPRASIDRFLSGTVGLRSVSNGVSDVQSNYGLALTTLSILVGLVLLIATANVANLQTARASARSREMALRVSIGAGRWRLVQLVMTEAMWLAALATLLGIVFAQWAAPVVVGMAQRPDAPVRLDLSADWRLFTFASLLALAIAALFTAAPAFRASSVTPLSALKGGEPRIRRRGMHALVGAQAAFCFVAVFVSALLLASLGRLSAQPTGFAAEGLLAIDATAPRATPEAWSQIAEQLSELDGIENVAMSAWPLLSGNTWKAFIAIDGQPADMRPFFLTVSPGWFDVMKIPILEGREFRRHERYPGVALVNEAFARQYYGGQSPIGRSFLETPSRGNALLREAAGTRYRVTIVGMVGDARYQNLRDPVPPTVYVPFSAVGASGAPEAISWATFIARTSAADPLSMAPIIRQTVNRLRSDFRISTMRTQTALNESHTIRERLLATLAVFFTGVAALLAGIGLWGVLHYSVVQHRRDLGVRLALGATVLDVVRCVAGGLLAAALAGSAVGVVLSLAAQAYLQSLLFDLDDFEPWTLVSAASFMSILAIAASLPALRAALRTKPAITLRSE